MGMLLLLPHFTAYPSQSESPVVQASIRQRASTINMAALNPMAAMGAGRGGPSPWKAKASATAAMATVREGEGEEGGGATKEVYVRSSGPAAGPGDESGITHVRLLVCGCCHYLFVNTMLYYRPSNIASYA